MKSTLGTLVKGSSIRLYARASNAFYNKKIYSATLLFTALRLALITLCIFFSYLLFNLSGYETEARPVLYYILFSLGLLFSTWYFIICGHSLSRTICFSDSKARKLRVINFISIKEQLKIVYLHILRFVFNALKLALFLFPSAVVLVLGLFFLESGMLKSVFVALILLFAVLFISGIFFFLISMQSLSLLDEIICAFPSLSTFQTVSYLRTHMKSGKLGLLLFKLSFVPWLLSCIMLVPSVFSLSFYKKSLSVYAKSVLRLYTPRPTQKPVVIMLNQKPSFS